MSIIITAVTFALGWANGANDVSKGVATLVGSGVTDPRRAVAWGSGWTLTGGLLGAAFGGAMLTTFGSGLLQEGVAAAPTEAVAALLGAAGWVTLATRVRLPVSTTHALIGAIVGATLVGHGLHALQWAALARKLLLPLLLSPLVALVGASLLAKLLAGSRSRPPVPDCLCLSVDPLPSGDVGAATAVGAPVLVAASSATCAQARPAAARLTFDHLHWLSSGATSLARGMNDAPKIAGLTLAAGALGAGGVTSMAAYASAIVGMIAGSLVAGQRVMPTLSNRITTMSHADGLASNAVTATLVASGAVLGLPMSTTHVSSGGLFGIGLRRGELQWQTAREIVLAWVITLPGAATLGALGALALRASAR